MIVLLEFVSLKRRLMRSNGFCFSFREATGVDSLKTCKTRGKITLDFLALETVICTDFSCRMVKTMPFDDGIIYTDQIVKIESTPRIIKRTSLFDKGFRFIDQTDILLNLMQEHGDITLDKATADPILNSLHLQKSDTQSTRSKVAILLGKYAEALMVMNCNQNDSFNRHFARKARFGNKSPNDFLNNFVAIGTGSTLTKANYRMHYQYSESQRDIVWVDKRDLLQLLTIPKRHGATAGLQIKVSYDWKSLKNKVTQYYYPILYFSMNDDWHELSDYIDIKKEEGDPDYEKVTLLPMDDYSDKILDMLYLFEDQLEKLIEGKITLKYLIEKSIEEKQTALGHALSRLPGSEHGCIISAKSIQEAREVEEIERKERFRANMREFMRRSGCGYRG